MDLGNSFKAIVHHLLIGRIKGFARKDGVLMVSALVYMVIHWIEPTVSHDIRLLGSDDITKLLYCIIS